MFSRSFQPLPSWRIFYSWAHANLIIQWRPCVTRTRIDHCYCELPVSGHMRGWQFLTLWGLAVLNDPCWPMSCEQNWWGPLLGWALTLALYPLEDSFLCWGDQWSILWLLPQPLPFVCLFIYFLANLVLLFYQINFRIVLSNSKSKQKRKTTSITTKIPEISMEFWLEM